MCPRWNPTDKHFPHHLSAASRFNIQYLRVLLLRRFWCQVHLSSATCRCGQPFDSRATTGEFAPPRGFGSLTLSVGELCGTDLWEVVGRGHHDGQHRPNIFTCGRVGSGGSCPEPSAFFFWVRRGRGGREKRTDRRNYGGASGSHFFWCAKCFFGCAKCFLSGCKYLLHSGPIRLRCACRVCPSTPSTPEPLKTQRP